VKTILGRPWRIYASTVYLDCEMSGAVRPEGWNDWKKPEATPRRAMRNLIPPATTPVRRTAPIGRGSLKNPTRKKSRLKPSSAARITVVLTCVGRLVPSAGNLNGVSRVAKNYCSTLGGVLATIVPADKKCARHGGRGAGSVLRINLAFLPGRLSDTTSHRKKCAPVFWSSII